MSAEDDDRDGLDESTLKSMRSVWLSMREEEPPAAGLSALLAAARDKAEAMKPRPTWWQRAFAMMRRPPVLALATAVVLLGGALFIQQRQGGDPVMTIRPEPAAEPVAETVAVDPPAREQANQTTERDALKFETASPAAGKAEEPPSVAPAVDTPAPAPPKRRPRPVVRPKADADSGTRAPRADVKDRAATPGSVGGLSIASDQEATAAAGAPAPAPPQRAPMMPDDARSEAGGEIVLSDRGGTRSEPSAEQLATQCESAAKRGDCAAVRFLAKKLEKQAPAVYKARIVRNPAIANCLDK